MKLEENIKNLLKKLIRDVISEEDNTSDVKIDDPSEEEISIPDPEPELEPEPVIQNPNQPEEQPDKQPEVPAEKPEPPKPDVNIFGTAPQSSIADPQPEIQPEPESELQPQLEPEPKIQAQPEPSISSEPSVSEPLSNLDIEPEKNLASTPSVPSGSITKSEAKDLIKQTKGKFFTVSFIKKDGTPRIMNARLGVKAYLKGGELPYNPEEKGLIPVFDVQKKAYRMISIDTIFNLKIGNNEYKVK